MKPFYLFKTLKLWLFFFVLFRAGSQNYNQVTCHQLVFISKFAMTHPIQMKNQGMLFLPPIKVVNKLGMKGNYDNVMKIGTR